jgi:hypothetical protein
MGWINTDVRFGRRRALLVIGREVLNDTENQFLRMIEERSPAVIEGYLRQVILGLRPELQGCVIEWLRYDWAQPGWEVGLSHESLEAVREGDVSPRILLERKAAGVA